MNVQTPQQPINFNAADIRHAAETVIDKRSGKPALRAANERIKLLVDTLFNGNQADFSRTIGICTPNICHWVNGRQGIHRGTLVRIANSLAGRVDYNWIVNGTGEPNFDGVKSSVMGGLMNGMAEPKADGRPTEFETTISQIQKLKSKAAADQPGGDPPANNPSQEVREEFNILLRGILNLGDKLGIFKGV